MKVIFLDIDGVLNYQNSDFIADDCLNNLRQIVNETGAKIVIISTWRVAIDSECRDKYVKKTNSQLDYYKSILQDKLTNELRWIDIAPDLSEDRSAEIELWLNNHDNIESYVILDDFNYEYDKRYPNNWVRPYWFTGGLNDKLVSKAIKILNTV